MELMGESSESDTTWIKFVDMMIESGIILDWIENGDFHKNQEDTAKKEVPDQHQAW